MSPQVLDFTNLNIEERRQFNNCCSDSTIIFNEIIGLNYPGNKNKVEWLLSPIASRHPHYSSLFKDCCYLYYIYYLIKDNKKHITEIVLPDDRLIKIIEKFFIKNNIKIKIISRENIKNNSFITLVKILRNFNNRLKDFLIFRLCSLLTRPKLWPKNKPVILLDTFIIENSFDQNGVFYDRYYTDFHKFFTKDELELFYFLPTLEGIPRKKVLNYLKYLRKSSFNFLIKDDYLQINDYLYAFYFSFLKLKIKIEHYSFLDFNILPLIREELISSLFDRTSFLAILNYRIAKRFKKKNIDVRCLYDWSENQIGDRGLILGFRKHYPNTPIIGYQGYIVSLNYHINIQPIFEEVKSRVIPDKIAVTGEALKKRVNVFTSDVDVIVAPAFRNQKLWAQQKYTTSDDKLYIIIALPYSSEFSSILVSTANHLSHVYQNRVLFFLKPHPIHVSHIYENKNIKRNLEYVSGDLGYWIERSDIFISNASSTCLEALARKKFTIVLEIGNLFFQNPIPNEIDANLYSICYDLESLGKEINKQIIMKKLARSCEVENEILMHYYRKPTFDSVREFFMFSN